MIRSRDWSGRTCGLVVAATGKPIEMGALVRSTNGMSVRVTGGRAPHHSNSTGRVWVASSPNGKAIDPVAVTVDEKASDPLLPPRAKR